MLPKHSSSILTRANVLEYQRLRQRQSIFEFLNFSGIIYVSSRRDQALPETSITCIRRGCASARVSARHAASVPVASGHIARSGIIEHSEEDDAPCKLVFLQRGFDYDDTSHGQGQQDVFEVTARPHGTHPHWSPPPEYAN